MKRDLELCRKILWAVEDTPAGERVTKFPFADEYYYKDINEHVVLLERAGLLEAEIVTEGDNTYGVIRRLTWDGHEFICASRDEVRWAKAKKQVGEAAWENIGFGVLQKLLDALTLKALGVG